MTRDDTKELLMMIQAAYPNYRPSDKTVAVNMWAKMLEEYSKPAVEASLQLYIKNDSSGFPPSIGRIIDGIYVIEGSGHMNESEAWALVAKAMKNSVYNASGEFEKLPETIQRAVGAPEQLRSWALDEKFSEEVAKAHFLKAYRAESERASMLERLNHSKVGSARIAQNGAETAKLDANTNNSIIYPPKSKNVSESPTEPFSDEQPLPDEVQEKLDRLRNRLRG